MSQDPNFDRLLKALYGDVAVYEQQEDALVAARNAAHAQEAAEEAEHRRAQRAAQEEAVAANKHRRCVSLPRAGGGDGAAAGSGAGPAGRTQRDRTPALEKPFLLCPVGWTVAHIAQLLSQWLPRRGFGPVTTPVPPSDIRLEPAPGTLRNSHRCLRGCTNLGSLAGELLGDSERGGGRGSSAHEHLVGG
ncbi:hypothetical protein GPECTOR_32g492 [Gonium pectorale]|uniref:Uncharacterized protein n=1 Tax=Gonium pectorale TaxID=33097 RepID=A0A150GDH4_GONPE|nr:hypothetical protein GPECTOR_32g492 [Gonium pectorale]|eukprot:KXZ47879.1 hypothetical protein GPECTOR_32g492 [Gonium pectorale]